jgi:hypothetical protein
VSDRAEPAAGAPRRLAIWEARHDNGWRTTLSEQPDGTYLVCVGPDTDKPVVLRKATLETARMAAVSALERGTGHTHCSERCSQWAITLTPRAGERRGGRRTSPEPGHRR